MSNFPQSLSVAAQFDDFCRLCKKDYDVTSDFIAFVKGQDSYKKQIERQQFRIGELQSENEDLRSTVRELKIELEHRRLLLEEHSSRQERCEKELQAKTKQVQLIREFILNSNLDNRSSKHYNAVLGHLGERRKRHAQQDKREESVGSELSPSPEAGEGTDRFSVRTESSSSKGQCYGRGEQFSTTAQQSSRPRRSPGGSTVQASDYLYELQPDAPTAQTHCEGPCSPKVIATTTVTISEDRCIQATSRVEATNAAAPNGKEARSSFLCSLLPKVDTELADDSGGGGDIVATSQRSVGSDKEDETDDGAEFEAEVGKLAASKISTPMFKEGGTQLGKTHSFVTKTAIKPENCKVCGKRIRFYKPALKCPACRLACHPDCKDNAPEECVPVTASTSRGNAPVRLADFVSPTPPMLPHLLVACLAEVQSRCLKEDDLHVSAEQKKRSQKLLEQFLQRKRVPVLTSAEMPVIVSVVTSFLAALEEPLITDNLWESVVSAADAPSSSGQLQQARTALSKLPHPNQDTLALLMSHLQGVVANSKSDSMTECLAETFGPVLVGCPRRLRTLDQHGPQTEKQIHVMKCLLALPSDYWSAFLVQGAHGGDENVEECATASLDSATTSACDRSCRGVRSTIGFFSRRRLSPLVE